MYAENENYGLEDLLTRVQNDLETSKNSSSSQSNFNVVYPSKLASGTNIRLLPPMHKEQHGLFYTSVLTLCLTTNGSSFQSFCLPDNWGVKSRIKMIIDRAKNAQDAVIKKRAAFAKIRTVYYMNALLFQSSSPDAVVLEDSIVTLALPATLGSQILSAFLSFDYQPDKANPFGITDRVKGTNLTFDKTGAGIDTKYSVVPRRNPSQMPEHYYNPQIVPNIVDKLKYFTKCPAYLESVLLNFLDGGVTVIKEDLKNNVFTFTTENPTTSTDVTPEPTYTQVTEIKMPTANLQAAPTKALQDASSAPNWEDGLPTFK